LNKIKFSFLILGVVIFSSATYYLPYCIGLSQLKLIDNEDIITILPIEASAPTTTTAGGQVVETIYEEMKDAFIFLAAEASPSTFVNNAPTITFSDLDLTYMPPDNIDPVTQSDGSNVFGFAGGQPETWAMWTAIFATGPNIVEFDIYINVSFSGQFGPYSDIPNGSNSPASFLHNKTALRHELVHASGFKHVRCPAELMAAAPMTNTNITITSPDLINGYECLYTTASGNGNFTCATNVCCCSEGGLSPGSSSAIDIMNALYIKSEKVQESTFDISWDFGQEIELLETINIFKVNGNILENIFNSSLDQSEINLKNNLRLENLDSGNVLMFEAIFNSSGGNKANAVKRSKYITL